MKQRTLVQNMLLALAFVALAAASTPLLWSADQELVLYNFAGVPDGAAPYDYGNLVFDSSGNLYGTTQTGGASSNGTIFQLVPGSPAWTENQLYSFTGGSDGASPYAGLVFDGAGNLYGTAGAGGSSTACGSGPGSGCGVVFELTPASGGGTETVIYSFTGGKDGSIPVAGLIFDASGNLYGTAASGGDASCVGEYNDPSGCGVVFELSPVAGGGWKQHVLHTFKGGKSDGASPTAALLLDASGNLYGVTTLGGASNAGVVFELTPTAKGPWKKKLVHSFSGGSGGRYFSHADHLIFDSAGNLYGTAEIGGNLNDCGGGGCGLVFELTPKSSGGWKERVLYEFTGTAGDGAYPEAGLVFDADNNLYGTTAGGGNGLGVVFELKLNSKGRWSETVLYAFAQGNDGCAPYAGLILGSSGSLYGATPFCGVDADGMIFELVP